MLESRENVAKCAKSDVEFHYVILIRIPTNAAGVLHTIDWAYCVTHGWIAFDDWNDTIIYLCPICCDGAVINIRYIMCYQKLVYISTMNAFWKQNMKRCILPKGTETFKNMITIIKYTSSVPDSKRHELTEGSYNDIESYPLEMAMSTSQFVLQWTLRARFMGPT